jgi:hypothetical protein
MLVGSRQRLQQSSSNPQIVIGNHIIQQVSSKKVVGVIIDEQLKWKEHNDAQCKKQFPVNRHFPNLFECTQNNRGWQ